MDQNVVHGFLHLSEVNPFIASSLQPRSRQTSKATLHAHMPKQDGPEPLHQALEQHVLTVGVSAFAFQGTNAYVVMGRWVQPGMLPEMSVLTSLSSCLCWCACGKSNAKLMEICAPSQI